MLCITSTNGSVLPHHLQTPVIVDNNHNINNEKSMNKMTRKKYEHFGTDNEYNDDLSTPPPPNNNNSIVSRCCYSLFHPKLIVYMFMVGIALASIQMDIILKNTIVPQFDQIRNEIIFRLVEEQMENYFYHFAYENDNDIGVVQDGNNIGSYGHNEQETIQQLMNEETKDEGYANRLRQRSDYYNKLVQQEEDTEIKIENKVNDIERMRQQLLTNITLEKNEEIMLVNQMNNNNNNYNTNQTINNEQQQHPTSCSSNNNNNNSKINGIQQLCEYMDNIMNLKKRIQVDEIMIEHDENVYVELTKQENFEQLINHIIQKRIERYNNTVQQLQNTATIYEDRAKQDAIKINSFNESYWQQLNSNNNNNNGTSSSISTTSTSSTVSTTAQTQSSNDITMKQQQQQQQPYYYYQQPLLTYNHLLLQELLQQISLIQKQVYQYSIIGICLAIPTITYFLYSIIITKQLFRYILQWRREEEQQDEVVDEKQRKRLYSNCIQHIVLFVITFGFVIGPISNNNNTINNLELNDDDDEMKDDDEMNDVKMIITFALLGSGIQTLLLHIIPHLYMEGLSSRCNKNNNNNNDMNYWCFEVIILNIIKYSIMRMFILFMLYTLELMFLWLLAGNILFYDETIINFCQSYIIRFVSIISIIVHWMLFETTMTTITTSSSSCRTNTNRHYRGRIGYDTDQSTIFTRDDLDENENTTTYSTCSRISVFEKQRIDPLETTSLVHNQCIGDINSSSFGGGGVRSNYTSARMNSLEADESENNDENYADISIDNSFPLIYLPSDWRGDGTKEPISSIIASHIVSSPYFVHFQSDLWKLWFVSEAFLIVCNIHVILDCWHIIVGLSALNSHVASNWMRNCLWLSLAITILSIEIVVWRIFVNCTHESTRNTRHQAMERKHQELVVLI